MQPKKNPKYDVHKKSRMIFFFSLCISFLLILTAFKWKHPISNPVTKPHNDGIIYEALYPVPITEITNTLPKAEPIKEKPTYLIPVEATEPILINEPSIEPPKELSNPPFEILVPLGEIPVEPDTFFIVEKMPLPKDGYEGFYEFLAKELKYPRPAVKSGTQGKVFVEFVVNKKGEPSNMRVIKGIGFGCDAEALRVISLTKWNTGKQRGVPVNVRMTLPILFQLR